MMKFILTLTGVAATTAFVLQSEPKPGPPLPPATPSASSPVGRELVPHEHELAVATDSILSATLLVETENLTAIAHVAQEHSQTEPLRALARDFVESQGQVRQRLQQASAGYGAGATDVGLHQNPVTSSGTSGTNDGTRGRPATDQAEVHSLVAPSDHIELARALGAQCYLSATTDLRDLRGVEFDRGFLAVEIASLRRTIDTMIVYQRYASTPLRNAIDADLEVMRADLEHARSYLRSMERGETR